MFMMMNLLATIFQRGEVKLVNAILVADMEVAIFVSVSKVHCVKWRLGTVTFLVINVF